VPPFFVCPDFDQQRSLIVKAAVPPSARIYNINALAVVKATPHGFGIFHDHSMAANQALQSKRIRGDGMNSNRITGKLSMLSICAALCCFPAGVQSSMSSDA
jgi:hypothetical protein